VSGYERREGDGLKEKEDRKRNEVSE